MEFNTTTTQEDPHVARTRTLNPDPAAKHLTAEATRNRALRGSRFAGRSVHTDSMPNVRSFTSSPFEYLARSNSRSF